MLLFKVISFGDARGSIVVVVVVVGGGGVGDGAVRVGGGGGSEGYECRRRAAEAEGNVRSGHKNGKWKRLDKVQRRAAPPSGV